MAIPKSWLTFVATPFSSCIFQTLGVKKCTFCHFSLCSVHNFLEFDSISNIFLPPTFATNLEFLVQLQPQRNDSQWRGECSFPFAQAGPVLLQLKYLVRPRNVAGTGFHVEEGRNRSEQVELAGLVGRESEQLVCSLSQLGQLSLVCSLGVPRLLDEREEKGEKGVTVLWLLICQAELSRANCSASGGLATRVVLRTVPAQPVWCLGGLWSPCERFYRASSLLGQRCPSGRRDSVGCLTGFAPFDFLISYLYPGRFAPALPVSSTLRFQMSVIPG